METISSTLSMCDTVFQTESFAACALKGEGEGTRCVRVSMWASSHMYRFICCECIAGSGAEEQLVGKIGVGGGVEVGVVVVGGLGRHGVIGGGI